MKDKSAEKTVLERQLEAEVAQEAAAAAQPEAPSAPAAPQDEAAALTAERDALKDQLLRARAEFDNYRKRTAREVERIRKTAAENVIVDLLPVVDNLERALDHVDGNADALAAGVGMVLKQLRGVLDKQGVEVIPAVGAPFDPNVHEAVMRTPSAEHAADLVAQEFAKGYRMGDYVLRPSKVIVSAGPAGADDSKDSE